MSKSKPATKDTMPRVSIFMPASLHEKLKREASKLDLSLSGHISKILQDSVKNTKSA